MSLTSDELDAAWSLLNQAANTMNFNDLERRELLSAAAVLDLKSYELRSTSHEVIQR